MIKISIIVNLIMVINSLIGIVLSIHGFKSIIIMALNNQFNSPIDLILSTLANLIFFLVMLFTLVGIHKDYIQKKEQYMIVKRNFAYLNIQIDLNKNIFLNKLDKYKINKEKLIEQMNNGDPVLIKNNIYVKKIETSQFRIDLFF